MLVVTVMGDYGSKFIDICFESILKADKIIFCWGEQDKDTLNKYEEWKNKYPEKFELISLNYDQDNPKQNGITRNFYLNYLRNKYPDAWNLSMDLDEVVEDLGKLVSFLQESAPGVYSVKMRHFHNDLGHEDATQKEHFVLNRLFKISEAGSYPEVEHPVLQPKNPENQFMFRGTTIWHLAHIQHCFEIKKRYEKNMKHSNIHTPEYLHNWYLAHILGQYPNSIVNPLDVPEVIWKNFGIDKDEFYFANRGIEMKHPIMVKQWYDYFKPESVLDLGCGRGAYLYFWKWFVNDLAGMEISDWAYHHRFLENEIFSGDISNGADWIENDFDLIIAFDVLEHLTDQQLYSALRKMYNHGKRFLISVPVIGDPNLNADKTHIQRKTKEEWIKLFEDYGIKIKPTPKEWLFAEQIIIGEK